MDAPLQAVVDLAIADLDGRLPPSSDPVRVLVARPETFPDTAIGCPSGGSSVAGGPVEGHRVVLRRGERVWLYTAGVDGRPHLCPSGDVDGGHDFVPAPRLGD